MTCRPTPTLSATLTVAEWWKNRRGESIRVTLSSYDGHNRIDPRTWFTENGRSKPGKGFYAEAKHLPRLTAAFAKAAAKARELRLLADDSDGCDQ